jgi:ubiquinone/menaquinone biosynthesis C-methylase UbiE
LTIEAFAQSTVGRGVTRVVAAAMESRFRYRFFHPTRILGGVDALRGQVLEIGCGTGFFSLPAANLLGNDGFLTALDILPESVDRVRRKAEAARTENLRVLQGDARQTTLPAASVDTVLLFGVIPAPMLPLAELLPEMCRVLKPGGGLAVWPPVPLWLPRSIVRSGSFAFTVKRNGVHNFKRL